MRGTCLLSTICFGAVAALGTCACSDRTEASDTGVARGHDDATPPAASAPDGAHGSSCAHSTRSSPRFQWLRQGNTGGARAAETLDGISGVVPDGSGGVLAVHG